MIPGGRTLEEQRRPFCNSWLSIIVLRDGFRTDLERFSRSQLIGYFLAIAHVLESHSLAVEDTDVLSGHGTMI